MNALDRLAVARNRRRLFALNDRHLGQTVFVVGGSPQLNRLTAEQLETLAHQPTIGLNRTHYRVRAPYFMSSYSQEVGIALLAGEADFVLHLCNTTRPTIPGSIAVFKRHYDDARGLPRRLHGHRPTLFTTRNAALAATHLALVMGARRIVYLGLEQRARFYFYDEDPELRERIIADLARVREAGIYELDHPKSTFERHVGFLRAPIEELKARPYFHVDHTPTFRHYFDELDRYGVEPIATSEDSVVLDAGARYVPLDEAFERFAVRPASRRPGRAAVLAASGARR
jgi:hypothetical protein